jgi:hypothetical protein
MGGTSGQPAQQPANPSGLTGSRAALAANQPVGANFSDWMASIPDWAQTTEGQSFLNSFNQPQGSAMAPATSVAPVAQTGPSAGNTAAGFQSGALPTADLSTLPTIGGRAPAPVPVVETPKAEALDPNRPGFWNGIELGEQTWKDSMAFPQAGVTDWNSWMAANPHLSTSFEITDKGPIGTPGNSWYHKKGDPR